MSWLTERPIAHRGLHDLSRGIPENSLAAFENAVRRGVPFEFDVQRTSDGVAVVQHDPLLVKIDDTRIPLARAGTRDLRHAARLSNGEALPLLDEVLELVAGAVPILVDVRRWQLDLSGEFERSLTSRLATYRGSFAVQSFDPTAVWRFAHGRCRPVGQASGDLDTVNRWLAWMGRTMATNVLTRPDFVTFQLSLLPSWWTDVWRRRGVTLLAYTARSLEDEVQARRVSDNFLFAGYTPTVYSRD